MKRFAVFFIVMMALVATASACDKEQAKQHQEQMKATLAKVHGSWEQVQKATTPEAKETAIKAHGAALAELQGLHEKHLAMAQESEKKMGDMMAKMKAEGKKCEMECCKKHAKDAHADHPKAD